MSWIYYNPNPLHKSTGDCVVRALTMVTGADWDTVYAELCAVGYRLKEMPSTNNVWRAYLYHNGFRKHLLPDIGPYEYTIANFCADHPKGEFLLFVGEHVVAVRDGDYYDTWDSGAEIPSFYWRK